MPDRDDGDLRCTTDFRRVYADLCWFLGVPPRAALGADFESVGLLA